MQFLTAAVPELEDTRALPIQMEYVMLRISPIILLTMERSVFL